MEKVAKQKNATLGQIALAWLLAQKPWIVPIPGTTKIERMIENSMAAEIELSQMELSEIQIAISKVTAKGESYPEDLQRRIDR